MPCRAVRFHSRPMQVRLLAPSLRRSVAIAACACTVSCGLKPEIAPYLVTGLPLNTGDTVLCVAVDPTDRHGIWSWGPGPDGCATRSTGPQAAFPAEGAIVSSAGDVIHARFQLRMIRAPDSTRPPIVEVRLMLANGEFRAMGSGARVPIVRRADLNIPEGWRQ